MKRWPLNKAYFWERAPFFRLLLPLIAGIVSYSIITPQHYLAVYGCLTVAFCGFCIAAFIKKQTDLLNAIRFASLTLAIAAIGWVFCYSNDIKNSNDWLGIQQADAFIARITKAPAEKEKTWKLEVENISAVTNSKLQPAAGKAFVYVYKNPSTLFSFHEGDTIILPVQWQPIKNAGNPYEFDYAQYCARNNIYYQQFLPGNKITLHNTLPAQLSWIQQGHQWCMLQLQTYITDKKTLGLIQAMLIGDEANLDNDLRQAYSETGIIHIIAISGSHITFFFFLFSFLLAWIRHKKYQWLKYILAIPLVWVYVLMSGAPPSAVRAALMFTILGIGFAFEQRSNSLNHLLATAFILLCVQPMWLYAVGFQLSFLAVLSLILFYRPIYKWVAPTNTIMKGIWGAIAASLAAELLTAPLVIYYFHLFPLLFIVANVAAYLFMGLVLVLGMIIVAVSSMAPVASVVAAIATYLVTLFNQLVFGMQALNPASFRFLDINVLELVLIFFIIGTLAIALLQEKKRLFIVSLAATCVFLGCLCFDECKALTQRRLIVYNILRDNHIELIDGKQHTVLAGSDTLPARSKNYVLKPAHTGLHAWKDAPPIDKRMLSINGNTVLILDAPLYNAQSFPVDYLVINYTASAYDLDQLQQVFHPKKIILGNTVKHKELSYWITGCKQRNISLHVVSQDGAFIL